MSKDKSKTVAQRCYWLYAYVAVVFLSSVSGIVKGLRMPPAVITGLSPQAAHMLFVAILFISAVIYAWLIIYLVTSKNIKRILLILKVMLVVRLLALLALIPKPDYYNLGIEITLIGATVAMLILLSSSKYKSAV